MDFYAMFAAQSQGSLPMDAWYPQINELQQILDDMEKAGHKRTKAYQAMQNFLDYAIAKDRYSARQTKITIQ